MRRGRRIRSRWTAWRLSRRRAPRSLLARPRHAGGDHAAAVRRPRHDCRDLRSTLRSTGPCAAAAAFPDRRRDLGSRARLARRGRSARRRGHDHSAGVLPFEAAEPRLEAALPILTSLASRTSLAPRGMRGSRRTSSAAAPRSWPRTLRHRRRPADRRTGAPPIDARRSSCATAGSRRRVREATVAVPRRYADGRRERQDDPSRPVGHARARRPAGMGTDLSRLWRDTIRGHGRRVRHSHALRDAWNRDGTGARAHACCSPGWSTGRGPTRSAASRRRRRTKGAPSWRVTKRRLPADEDLHAAGSPDRAGGHR